MAVGIEHLKKPLKFGVDLWKQYNVSKEGGFKGRDIFDFLDELLQLPGILADGELIKSEWNDRTPEELDELVEYAIAELGETIGTAKTKVVAVLGWLSATLEVQLAFKKKTTVTPADDTPDQPTA